MMFKSPNDNTYTIITTITVTVINDTKGINVKLLREHLGGVLIKRKNFIYSGSQKDIYAIS